MKRILLVLLILLLAPLSAGAEADGPDRWAVSGIRADAVLNIHAAPKAKARIVGHAPHDARGLDNLGCKGTASFSDWLKMHGAARRAAAGKRWCRIRYNGVEGWVPGRFLVEDARSASK
jgi:hypothetical protein